MNILWLDDVRRPTYWELNYPKEVTVHWATNVDYAIFILKHFHIDIVDFDHDLGDDTCLTGYDLAKYIVRACNPDDIEFHIHSLNPVGAQNIRQLLTHYGYKEIF